MADRRLHEFVRALRGDVLPSAGAAPRRFHLKRRAVLGGEGASLCSERLVECATCQASNQPTNTTR